MAVGAARQAIRRRKPDGCGHQYRHRRGRSGGPGRLHPASDHIGECHQRDALRQAQFQFHPRHRTGRRHPSCAAAHGGPPVVSGDDNCGIHCPAKASPGKINLASAGIGSSTHVAGEMFKMMAGLDLVHVPYRGAQVLPALLAGDVPQVFFGPLPSSIEYVRTGKLRVLAVTTATRSPMLPDIPALNETLLGYEASTWFGVGAPKATPAKIVDKLNKKINAVINDPKLKMRLADFGGTLLVLSPADFGKFIAQETEKWGKVIGAANIKPE